MDNQKYLEQSTKLLGHYMQIKDYKKAFLLLLNIMQNIDEDKKMGLCDFVISLSQNINK
jgi:hypothetical protein